MTASVSRGTGEHADRRLLSCGKFSATAMIVSLRALARILLILVVVIVVDTEQQHRDAILVEIRLRFGSTK